MNTFKNLILGLVISITSCHKPPLDGVEKLVNQGSYEIRTVAFYNVENLFDVQNDSLVNDDERTPEGKDKWTPDRYALKLKHISRVLSEIGKKEAKRMPDIIGICEIENRGVLEDLLKEESLRSGNYGIVHYDSPDLRGVDVALFYNKNCFIPIESRSVALPLRDYKNRLKTTRDQLVVFGLLDGEPIYISVNHWPSRSGGQTLSDPLRMQAAALQRRILDSILDFDAQARYITMGDFNDDPTDPSIRYGFGTSRKQENLPPYLCLNPMEKLYVSGMGTLAYRDKWSLFDQILLNGNWFKEEEDTSYRYWKAGIYQPDYLKTQNGSFRGYPFRTYAGGTYQGGYSDHFPVYAYLIRKADAKR
jgi:hypothetical protein